MTITFGDKLGYDHTQIPDSFGYRHDYAVFLVCYHVTRRPQIYNRMFLKNLHENRVTFPEEGNAFILVIQHGRRDVTCKPAILGLQPRDKAAMLVANTIEFFLEEFK